MRVCGAVNEVHYATPRHHPSTSFVVKCSFTTKLLYFEVFVLLFLKTYINYKTVYNIFCFIIIYISFTLSFIFLSLYKFVHEKVIFIIIKLHVLESHVALASTLILLWFWRSLSF